MLLHINKLKWALRIVRSLCLLAIGGIIGGISYAIYLSLGPKIAASMSTSTSLWATIVILAVLSLSTTWGWLNDRKKLLNLLSFDTKLDMILVEKISANNPQNIIQAFTERALDLTVQYLTSPRKALLLIKDANGQHLISLGSFGWGSQSNISTTFPINHNNSDKSTAAEAFKTKELIMVHIAVKNGNSQADHSSYRPSPNNSPPFEGSLICIPIIGTSNDCLGVVCFDSYSQKEFDTLNTRKTLQILARHIAGAVQIQQNIIQSQATP
jgi:hypothetical protein